MADQPAPVPKVLMIDNDPHALKACEVALAKVADVLPAMTLAGARALLSQQGYPVSEGGGAIKLIMLDGLMPEATEEGALVSTEAFAREIREEFRFGGWMMATGSFEADNELLVRSGLCDEQGLKPDLEDILAVARGFLLGPSRFDRPMSSRREPETATLP